MSQVHLLSTQLKEVKFVYEKAKEASKLTNVSRRQYYSSFQLIKLDLEEIDEVKTEDKPVIDNLIQEIDLLSNELKLVPVKRKFDIFYIIEVCVRFLGVSAYFSLVSTLFSFPVLLLGVVDEWLNHDPFHYWSVALKLFLMDVILLLQGVTLNIEGSVEPSFNAPITLLNFTHASNMDGFLVIRACPVKQVAFGKKELFLVPCFSWISLAFGGIPVDRGNRNRAIKALQRSIKLATSTKKSESRLCIAIAPEGTRSQTGQLLPYKKGAFHLCHDLQAPILPFVIFGAADLYPRGSWVNNTGVVTVRFLNPIPPTAADSRDKMLRLARRRTLEALAKCPNTVGQDCSILLRLLSFIANLVFIMMFVLASYGVYEILITKLGLSLIQGLLYCSGAAVFITVFLYIYFVYVVAM